MRTSRLALISCALVPFTLVAQQATPSASARPACAGAYNVLRIDDVRPGMMSTFLKAVEAHQAWYARAGQPDKITAMRVIEKDPQTKVQSYSETKAITSHTEPAMRSTPLPPEGESYKAFVDQYKASSVVVGEYVVCSAN